MLNASAVFTYRKCLNARIRYFCFLLLGICQAGGSVGGFVFTPLLQKLIQSYGWQGALLIMAGILLHGSLIGLVIHAFGQHINIILISEFYSNNKNTSMTIIFINKVFLIFTSILNLFRSECMRINMIKIDLRRL